MATTFLLPLAMGACEALGGNVLTDAFGMVAMVAMTPLMTIQVMGLVGKLRKNAAARSKPARVEFLLDSAENGIIYWDAE